VIVASFDCCHEIGELRETSEDVVFAGRVGYQIGRFSDFPTGMEYPHIVDVVWKHYRFAKEVLGGRGRREIRLR